ncbi:acetyl-CoA synthetase [Thioalbus denitrificans]|uniref:acetate--CoA ligase n=2 Tax=Thioalbus denitrificans TaxID=547122 RepID=A0A369BT75_9GAMM|nr:acetyl-CoA synthetase [Thioalbus denitrificans]
MPMNEGPPTGRNAPPNLADYEAECAAFSWEAARAGLEGLPGGAGLNIAHEAVDRHAAGPRRERIALRALRRDGSVQEITYGALRELTGRFANLLQGLGVGPGETVFTLLGRVPELHVTAVGAWKHRSVFCPLFSAFGPEPVRTRLEIGRARVLVTTAALYRRKVEPLRAALPHLAHVLLVGLEGAAAPAGTHDFDRLLRAADARFDIPPTDPQAPALLHFTSGTTGRPKGALHVHEAVVAHHATGRLALDLHPEDIYWCTADPGWVTGISYGVIAPLTVGATLVVDEEEFDVERWYRVLQEQGVNVWYTAPTAVRMMMKYGAEVARGYDFSALRFLASVGEPLNPGAVEWGREAFGLPFHDNWWQTETGAIMIANFRAMAIRPGSMGRPVPGIEAAIVRRTGAAGVEVVEEAGVTGELALRSGWPSMFRGYLGDEARYRKCFAGGWYLSGDLARRDADGYFWFVGRADDLIKSAGHLIGPFEVESVLMEHPAVAEAGVIGKPDPMAGEIVKAFVVLKPGLVMDRDLQRQLLAHARRRLGAAVAPKEIEARPELPKTRSGKIMRRLLKAQETGQPAGDLSTLSGDA